MKIIKIKDRSKRKFLNRNISSYLYCNECLDMYSDFYKVELDKKFINKYKHPAVFIYNPNFHNKYNLMYKEINYLYFDKESVLDICSIQVIPCTNNCYCSICEQLTCNTTYVKFYNCHMYDYYKDNGYNIVGTHGDNYISFPSLKEAKLFVMGQLKTLIKLVERQKLLSIM